jgi:drug/metabolite transporter (DMT)-like permease
MIAFASNSLLCRAALRDTGIDAASFTFARIFSGAAALWIILQGRRRLIVDSSVVSPATPEVREGGSLVTGHSSLFSGLALFGYAAAFSFAYNTLSAGTGALLLFGAVQATMILWGIGKGERLDVIQIAGLLIALGGLVALVFPGISAPPIVGSALMLAAGVAWGVYSLRGKGARDALAATAGNFIRAVPFAALTSVIMFRQFHFNSLGIAYAIVSGAITSGIGYVLWYAALSGLKATSAATVQLSVPVIAATGGILLLSEPISLRYLIASIAILGGIFLVIIERRSAPAV